MADTDLTIRLKLDKANAEQQSKLYHQGERQRISQTLKDNQEAQRLFLAESRAASRARRDQITADAKAERESNAETAKANRAAQAEAKKGLKDASDALRKRIADETALKTVLTQSQIAERARLELTQQLNRKRIDSTKDVMVAENRHFKSLKVSTSEITQTTEGLIRSYLGIGTAIAAVGTLGAAWQKVAQTQRESHAAYMDMLKESRSGAAVKGTTPEAYAAGTLKTAVASGLTLGEADTLTRQFEGSVPIGLQKGNISRTTADEILSQTAVVGARLGGDQSTRGELAGIVSQFGKIDTAEQGLGKIEAVRKQLVDGRGDDGPLTRALLNVSGTLANEGGMLGTIEETAALVGTTSLAGGAQSADTRALQVTRASRGSTIKQAKALESEFGIKVGSTENLESRLEKMVPKLRKIKSDGGDTYSYLRDTLDMPAENIEALQEMVPNFEAFKSRAAEARETSKTGGASVVAENKKFLGSSEGRTMRAKAKGDAGQFIQGQKQKDYRAVVAEAEADIKGQDPTLLNSLTTLGVDTLGRFTGAGNQSEERANRIMGEELDRRGISNPLGGVTGALRGATMSPTERGTSLMGTLRENGIDPAQLITEKLGEKLDKLINKVEEGNVDRKEGNKPLARNAGQAVGKPPAARP